MLNAYYPSNIHWGSVNQVFVPVEVSPDLAKSHIWWYVLAAFKTVSMCFEKT